MTWTYLGASKKANNKQTNKKSLYFSTHLVGSSLFSWQSIENIKFFRYFYVCSFVLTYPVSDLIVQIAQEDTSSKQTAAQGSQQSVCPHIWRQTSTLEPSWGSQHLWEPEPELPLQLQPGWSVGLGLWLAEPEVLGDADSSTFPKLRV